MKILVTGGNGYLGTLICNKLSSTNEIYTLSRSNSNYNYNLDFEIPEFNQNFDIVIHAAGKAHSIPLNDNESKKFFLTNVIGTNNLLDALFKSHLPKQFVFISSVSVYGLVSGLNIDETAPLLAEDPYGKSKIEAEKLVEKWCLMHNVKYTILRLPLIVGANAPGNLGSMIRSIKRGYYFNIAGGFAKKSMVLGKDVATTIMEASYIGGIYNLTDGFHPSFRELSLCISKKMKMTYIPNMPLFIAKLLAKFGDIFGHSFPINSNKLTKITSTLTFNDNKARNAFGWNPTPVLNGL
jgi:nucleoside-diphosphate-sugar epimerase